MRNWHTKDNLAIQTYKNKTCSKKRLNDILFLNFWFYKIELNPPFIKNNLKLILKEEYKFSRRTEVNWIF